jgi:hypothetical protein
MAKESLMSKHTDIPGYVYETLRSIHESRVRRASEDQTLARVYSFTDHTIFLLMPDHKALVWDAAAQPKIIAWVLACMMDYQTAWEKRQ